MNSANEGTGAHFRIRPLSHEAGDSRVRGCGRAGKLRGARVNFRPRADNVRYPRRVKGAIQIFSH